jgi:hypothetical protein
VLQPESRYEVAGDGSSSGRSGRPPGAAGDGERGGAASGVGAPQRGRQRKAAGAAPLLAGQAVFVLGAAGARDSCVSLVRAAGGTVAVRLPPSASQEQGRIEGGGAEPPGLLALVPEGALQGDGHGGSSKSQLAHAAAVGVPVLSAKWLTDSVSCLQLLPRDGYVLAAD